MGQSSYISIPLYLLIKQMKKQELDDFIPSCGSQFLLNIQRRTSHVVFKAETSIVQRFTTGISGPWITDSIPSDESSSTHQLKGMSRQTVHQRPAASTCLSLTERREQLNRCNQPTFICWSCKLCTVKDSPL